MHFASSFIPTLLILLIRSLLQRSTVTSDVPLIFQNLGDLVFRPAANKQATTNVDVRISQKPS